ncbi:hypothetical protein GCM10018965_016890 [Nonomuraea roseola]
MWVDPRDTHRRVPWNPYDRTLGAPRDVAEREGEMGEFTTTIERRLCQAKRGLDEARSVGDDYLADTLTAEIEDLRRLADEHGVLLPR